MENEQHDKLEVIEVSALESMERASIDVQISTAKKYPRSLAQVKQTMLSYATLDIETAKSTFYVLPPRKSKGNEPPKKIEGPSIRMAEIAIASYQHLRCGARIISDDGKQLTAQGVCHDLQNNVCISVEVKRRITTSEGRRYSDDMVVMTGNAACSIALRNAVFKVVPFALVKPVYLEAKKLATGEGDIKSLAARRVEAIQHFLNLGVRKEKIFAVLEVKGIEDVGFEHIAVLIGYANAVKDGETTLAEIFDAAPEKEPESIADVLKKTSPGVAGQSSGGGVEWANTTPLSSGVASITPEQDKKNRADLDELTLDLELGEARMLKMAINTKQVVPEGAKSLRELPPSTIQFLLLAARDTKRVRQEQADEAAAAEKK